MLFVLARSSRLLTVIGRAWPRGSILVDHTPGWKAAAAGAPAAR
jgi:hypothetical protein